MSGHLEDDQHTHTCPTCGDEYGCELNCWRFISKHCRVCELPL